MARDLMVDDKGDFVIDDQTHDLVMVSGIDEIAQRIKATLEIRYHEMMLLDPEMGMDYTDFFGKRFKEENAAFQLRETIMQFVPEVDSVDDIKFNLSPDRHLTITFKAMATPTESTVSEPTEGAVEIGD